MPLAYMKAYPPTISCRAASLTCRSRCSDGAATLTTQMSKPAMNIASSTTGSISQRRESGWDTVSVTDPPRWPKPIGVRCRSNCTTVVELIANLIYAGEVMDDVVEPAVDDMLLPKVLAALADPHRLASVRFLARNGESWCTQVMQEAGLELSKSTFSHHLRILREAGLVTKRIQGAKGYAQLRKQDVDRRFPGLLDSVLNADNPALVGPPVPLPAVNYGRTAFGSRLLPRWSVFPAAGQ